MTFEKDYAKLVQYAKGLLYEYRLNIDPEDCVNDAFIKYIESGKPYFIDYAKSLIKGFFYTEVGLNGSTQSLETAGLKSGIIEHEKYCRKCKESKPIAAFGFYNNDKCKRKTTTFDCLECRNKYKVQWQKDNKDLWNAYMKSRYTKKNKIARPIHDLWNEANKRYQQKQKEQLTDVYIRGILRSKINPKDITPELIEMKRTELLEKRRAA